MKTSAAMAATARRRFAPAKLSIAFRLPKTNGLTPEARGAQGPLAKSDPTFGPIERWDAKLLALRYPARPNPARRVPERGRCSNAFLTAGPAAARRRASPVAPGSA